MAMTLSEPPSGAARTSSPASCSASASSPRTSAGARPACSRSSGSASSRASRTSSPATPPTSSSPRSTRSPSATASNLVVEGYDFAPTFSIWTTIEECLNPPLIWERGRGFYTTEPFSEPELFDFPGGIGPCRVRQRRARGGRARPARDRLPPRHLQVRPRRRVHRRAADAPQARPRPHRAGARARRRGRARATSSPPRSPTRPRSATG